MTTLSGPGANRCVTRRALFAGAGAAVLSGVVLAACERPSAAGVGAIKMRQTSREVTVRWSTWGDDKNPFNQAALDGMKLFNQIHPNIKVSVEPQIRISGKSWTSYIPAQWIAGTGPDMTGHCCQWGPVFARQGFLANLTPFIKRDMPPRILEDYTVWLIDLFHEEPWGQYALPMYTGVRGFLYNRTIFRERGVPFPDKTWNWVRWREEARKLTDREKGVFAKVFFPVRSERMNAWGAHMVDPKNDRKAVFDSPKALAALQFEHDLAHVDRTSLIRSGPKAMVPKGTNYYKQLMAGGKSAAFEFGSWGLTRVVKFVGDAIEWDVAPMLAGPNGDRGTLATNDGWSIWKGSKVIDEAWELLKWLQDDTWMQIVTKQVGQQTARKSFLDKWVRLLKEGYPALADKHLQEAYVAPIREGWARPIELWRKQAESSKIYNAAHNKSVRDDEIAVNTAMKDAARQINEINARA